jgi:hypothetical protein
VIDNVVWIDSWLSIAGTGCDLTGVGAGEEQARKVVVGEALKDPVARGVKCGPHGGKNSKMKSVDGFLVEPQNQGQAGTSWEPSHEW